MKKNITVSFLGSERRFNNSEWRNIGETMVDLLAILSREYEHVTVFTNLGPNVDTLWSLACFEAAKSYDNIEVVGLLSSNNDNYWDEQWKLKSHCSSIVYVDHYMVNVYEYMSEKSDMIVRLNKKETFWIYNSRKLGNSIITLFP